MYIHRPLPRGSAPEQNGDLTGDTGIDRYTDRYVSWKVHRGSGLLK